jgi:hypothetical protein
LEGLVRAPRSHHNPADATASATAGALVDGALTTARGRAFRRTAVAATPAGLFIEGAAARDPIGELPVLAVSILLVVTRGSPTRAATSSTGRKCGARLHREACKRVQPTPAPTPTTTAAAAARPVTYGDSAAATPTSPTGVDSTRSVNRYPTHGRNLNGAAARATAADTGSIVQWSSCASSRTSNELRHLLVKPRPSGTSAYNNVLNLAGRNNVAARSTRRSMTTSASTGGNALVFGAILLVAAWCSARARLFEVGRRRDNSADRNVAVRHNHKGQVARHGQVRVNGERLNRPNGGLPVRGFYQAVQR